MRLCILALAFAVAATAQTGADDFQIYTEHPRLLLPARRLRLLKRERERQSMRWNQFETLMRGKAQMVEPAFSQALFHSITGDAEAAKSAIEAALRPATGTRQTAIVLDWCDGALNDTQRSQLTAKLQRSLKEPTTSMISARDQAFAAIASGDAATLQRLVGVWWKQVAAPALRSGDKVLSHADLYPFLELAHAVRDNMQIDLRDDILSVFRDLALERVLSYYPASWPAAENEYRIPYFAGKGDPDLRLAALNRAAEFALVAFESNAQEMQFLQGWLLHDRYALRGSFGAPYELLWANPYQPGLPYEKLPLSFHNSRTGALLVRSSWEEDAIWMYASGGTSQLFRDGQIRPAPLKGPLVIGDTMIVAGAPAARELQVAADAPAHWYLLGLKPSTTFDVEVDDEEMTDAASDRSGILHLEFHRRAGQAVYLHEPRQK